MTKLTNQTKLQIKKVLAQLGLTAELSGRGKDWEVELATEDDAALFLSHVSAGGFQTGYGAWILRPNYQDLGDWNDKSSRHHY